MSRHATGKRDKCSEQRRLQSAAGGDGREESSPWSSAFRLLFWAGDIGVQAEEEFVGPVPPAAAQLGILKFLLRCVFSENNQPPSSLSDAPVPERASSSSPPLPADHVLHSGAVLFPGEASFPL